MNSFNPLDSYRRKGKSLLTGLLLAIFVLLPVISAAEIEITLNNSFIEKYKNKATVDVMFTVDKAHKKPNAVQSGGKDGDMHIAGRASEIGLPIVAEIMNAASEKDAVDIIHGVEGTGESIKLAGVWRIWCEHGGGSQQVQGNKLEPFDTTNPDHVFEIHPVTQVKDKDISDSFRPIENYSAYGAQVAFVRYENTKCKIIPKSKTTTIVTNMVGYNYVEFIMEINDDKQFVVEDGRMVMASVFDLDEELVVRNRRMVFVKDTPPEKAVKDLKRGDRLHVLGIPRIDLALVSWRAKNFKNKPDILNWTLPYEIIVVGIFEDNK